MRLSDKFWAFFEIFITTYEKNYLFSQFVDSIESKFKLRIIFILQRIVKQSIMHLLIRKLFFVFIIKYVRIECSFGKDCYRDRKKLFIFLLSK